MPDIGGTAEWAIGQGLLVQGPLSAGAWEDPADGQPVHDHHERDGVRKNPEMVNRRLGGLHELSCGVMRNKSAAIRREKNRRADIAVTRRETHCIAFDPKQWFGAQQKTAALFPSVISRKTPC
jgi:hypothetical protein